MRRLLGILAAAALLVPAAVSATTLNDYTNVDEEYNGWTVQDPVVYTWSNGGQTVDIDNTVTNVTNVVIPPGLDLTGTITVMMEVWWDSTMENWTFDGVDKWQSPSSIHWVQAVGYDGTIDDGGGTFYPYWNVGDGSLTLSQPSETYSLRFDFNFDARVSNPFTVYAPEYAIPVPEPSLALVLIGGAGLLACVRRGKRG